MLDYGIRGQVVMVTGAASGIGRATAMMAASQGAAVVLADLSSTALDTVEAEIIAAGAAAFACAFDVRDAQATEDAVAQAERKLGAIQGLVAAAGVGGPAPASTMNSRTWSEVIDINMTGVFCSVQAVGRRMIERRHGAIVTVGSTSALGGTRERAHYCASKHGVVGLSRALAIEWGPSGIRVNCVAPGPVDTPLLRKHWPQRRIDREMLDRIPLRRLATAEDQAKVCLFLLSDAAAYVSGVVLPVNGGLSAGYLTHLGDDDQSP